MREYRGIKIDDKHGKLLRENGEFSRSTVKNSLDSLVELLNENNHEILSPYAGNDDKILIDFKCGHEPSWKTPKGYKNGRGCYSCGRDKTTNAKKNKGEQDLLRLIEERGHELASNYIDSYTKILVDYKCGHEPSLKTVANYLKSEKCPKCFGEKEIEGENNLNILIAKNNHKLLSKYQNNKSKVLIDFNCKNGNSPQIVSVSYYKNKYKIEKCCPICSNTHLNAKANFEVLVKEKGHKLLSEYKNANSHVLIDFNCGHKPHKTKPSNYKNNKGCPKCSKVCSEQAKENLFALIIKNKHELLSDYVNSSVKVLIDFNCGHSPRWIAPHSYKEGCKCIECLDRGKTQSEKDLKYLIKENNHKWVKGEYIDSRTKILIDYNCGHKPSWKTPNDYKNGGGCRFCKQSKGEKIIANWLQDNNIEFEQEIEFSELPNKRFDIAIPDYKLIVEIHGGQHFKEMNGWGRGLEFEQENDLLKKTLCFQKAVII